MSLKKRNRNEITIEQKRELCLYAQEHPQLKQVELRLHFQAKWNTNIGSSTLSDILKNSEKWFDTTNIRSSNAKRIRQAEQPYLEEMILIWMSDTKAHNLPINDEMIIEKAKMFGKQIGISCYEFKYSNGWLDKNATVFL